MPVHDKKRAAAFYYFLSLVKRFLFSPFNYTTPEWIVETDVVSSLPPRPLFLVLFAQQQQKREMAEQRDEAKAQLQTHGLLALLFSADTAAATRVFLFSHLSTTIAAKAGRPPIPQRV
jgi:hypothetical protein